MQTNLIELCGKCGLEARCKNRTCCRTCHNTKRQKTYAENPELGARRMREWRERHGIKIEKYHPTKRCRNGCDAPAYRIWPWCQICCNAERRKRYAANPAKGRALSKASKLKLRQQVLEAYGNKCACPHCPETNPAFLSIDHIGGGGNSHRRNIVGLSRSFYAWLKQRGYPKEGFQLLCYNCNLGRAFNGGKECPHQLSPQG